MSRNARACYFTCIYIQRGFLYWVSFTLFCPRMAAEEQRVYIKVRTLLGVSSTDIKADLDKVYGDSALSYATVTRWSVRFKAGQTSIKDEARPGRPLSAFDEKDVGAVEKLLAEDARRTVEEISISVGISSSAVRSILIDRLKLRKVCARWVPHLLTQEEKDRRVEIASELLAMYADRGHMWISEIVTGDETWISFFEPDGKENNKVWIGENGARPQIARRSKSVRRVMYVLFFNSQGMVAQIPVPQGHTVTGIFYAQQVLPAILHHYEEARPRTGVRGIKLLHDNAPAHKSTTVQTYLQTNGLKTLPHPAYSPDLAPCDFWLNKIIKEHLRGRKFETRHALGSAIFQCTNSIPKETYRNVFEDWIKRLKKCVEVHGEYFEGLD